jgi:hypothetical protein
MGRCVAPLESNLPKAINNGAATRRTIITFNRVIGRIIVVVFFALAVDGLIHPIG